VATHPVHADAGRRRRRTDVHPRDTRAVEVHSDPRSHHHLDGIVGATDDVATDVVGVVGVEFRGSSGEAGDDSVAETGGESLDLVQYRVGGVAGAPVRYMRVGIQGWMVPTERLGSARYCCATMMNGRSGIRPVWVARSAATTSSNVPQTYTVPAARQCSS
jgi:hypothetical protein